MNYAQEVHDLCSLCVAKDGDMRVECIIHSFVFSSEKLAEAKPRIAAVIRAVASDSFLRGKGGGMSFLSLCEDRAGSLWAEHGTMEMLVGLAIGAGLGGFCLPREVWNVLPGAMPYVWFAALEGIESP